MKQRAPELVSIVVGGVIDLLNWYPPTRAFVEALQSAGGAGALVADWLLSPLFGLVLIVVGFVLLVRTRTMDSERVFVSRTPEELTSLYRGRTTHQADKLFADYKGKWIKVSGAVDDVSKSLGQHTMSIRDRQQPALILSFPRSNAQTVSHLNVGEVITVQGRIDSAFSGALYLKHCGLVSVSAPQPR